jgi:hypothetical protein
MIKAGADINLSGQDFMKEFCDKQNYDAVKYLKKNFNMQVPEDCIWGLNNYKRARIMI